MTVRKPPDWSSGEESAFYGPDYERMVDWEKRLANELPFFEQLFKERAIRRVADVACGVGRHANAFAKQGLTVVGADANEQLLEIARERAWREEADVRFVRADFLHLADVLPVPFDAVTCLGNSLPHLRSEAQVRCALEQMAVLVRAGGTLIIHVRSAEHIWAKGDHVSAARLVEHEGKKALFVRMVETHAPTVTFNIIRVDKQDERWDLNVRSTQLRPIGAEEMERLLSETGFEKIAFYGDYQRSPFEPEKSEDLLVVAEQTGGGERA